MKKKYGFIFLVIAIIMFGLYIVYNYTDLFTDKNNLNKSNGTIKYDYVKSRDMNKKTKIEYRVLDNMVMNDYNSNDFYKNYTDSNNLFLTAYISEFKGTMNDYVSEQYDMFKLPYEEKGQTVTSDDILCQYICKRYKIYNKDNTISADEFKVYINASEYEMFELSYHMDNGEFSNEIIENTIKDIKVTNDAVYKYGTVIDDKLIINLKLKKEKTLDIILNGIRYEEVASGNNNVHMTQVVNTETDDTLTVQVKFKRDKIDFVSDIDNYFSNSIKEEKEVNGMKIYEYTLNNNKYYVMMIDEEAALIVDGKEENIDINDFTNIKVKGV